MENIVLIGFGGHARSVADCIERTGQYKIIGYTDIRPSSCDCGYAYLGTDESLTKIYESGTQNAAVTIGQIGTDCIRHRTYELLKDIGFELPVIADPSAIIAGDAKIAEGVFIGKGAIVNGNTKIGKMSIINSGALLEHDNRIGEFCHVAVRATLCGEVTVGNNSFIGTNATVIQGIRIGSEAVVGAGSIVLHDIEDGQKRYGVV